MSFPTFQPISGLATPFAIGLQRLDPRSICQVDEKFPDYLAQKLELWRDIPNEIFLAQKDTLQAQNQVLELILDNLSAMQGDKAAQRGRTISLCSGEYELRHEDFHEQPLMLASLLVQDDLILMRKRENGWVLAAASLCFPSHWRLDEKFGRPMGEIHAPIPDLNARIGARIDRIFDNLRPELPVWRENWSLDSDPGLRQAVRNELRHHKHDKAEPSLDTLFLRAEYQTLRKLPVSGDILFTVKILIEPLRRFISGPQGAERLETLKDQMAAMSPQERNYKNFDAVWQLFENAAPA
ncbi:MAG: DUF3445 domain-containing protein [Pseudomonadota bacterium]